MGVNIVRELPKILGFIGGAAALRWLVKKTDGTWFGLLFFKDENTGRKK